MRIIIRVVDEAESLKYFQVQFYIIYCERGLILMRAVSYPYNDRTKSYRAITVERDVVSWTDFHLHFFSIDDFLMKQENCKSRKNIYVALRCIILYQNIHSSDIFT